MPELDSGATAWILTSAALVLLMTPGLALFYGGMARSKSVLNMMMMSFGAIGVVSLLWVFYGYSLTFGDDNAGVIGDLSSLGLRGMLESGTEGGIPDLLFAGLPADVRDHHRGADQRRDRRPGQVRPWVLFAGVWATLVYFPVAHWVWAPAAGSSRDWARSTSPAAPSCTSTPVRRRWPWPWCSASASAGRRTRCEPHNLPLVLLGAGLLWFGWFGFNAGSALRRQRHRRCRVHQHPGRDRCRRARLAARRAAARRQGTTLGAASGAVAGLVAITPACGYVDPLGAMSSASSPV